ncbi:uncharacterized protein LOC121367881 [Gigantopelta aegis]|uniref:uncharacterized protein LOC121367881 n=1 Tax=Gigantopelta aegis TaxID=1735272 RepID=UPI001B88A6C4|nr:uncharacterized protein LOC121367881 [Gigantopelta aegis]
MRHLSLLWILAFVSVAMGLDFLSSLKSRNKRSFNMRTMYNNALRQGQTIYDSRKFQAPVPGISESNEPLTYGSFYEQRADQYENQVPQNQFINQVKNQQISSKPYQQTSGSGPGNVKWNVVRNGNSYAFSYVYSNRPVVHNHRVTGTGGINTKYNQNMAAGNPTFTGTGGMRPVFNPNTGFPIPDPRFINRVNPGINGPRIIINGPMDPRINGINPQFNGPRDPRINGLNPINGGPIDPRLNGLNPITNGPKPINNGPIDPPINRPIIPVNPGFINTPVGPSNPIIQPTGPVIPINGGPLINPGFGKPQDGSEPVALGLSQGPAVGPATNNPSDPLVFTRQSDTWFWGGNKVSGPLRGAVQAGSK